jgi:ubiquinone/menaquinone biosynthesis C-methylase UbiE
MTLAERRYYDQRAAEYDDWYEGTGLYAERARPGWHEELAQLVSLVSSFAAGNWLDAACGTGFLTRHLRGTVVAVDQSLAMLGIARQRLPGGRTVQGDALQLPFPSHRFENMLSGHFYGHLREPDRARFLAEARRVAERLVIVDAAWRQEVQPEEMQERVLNDSSRHTVYKRYFTPAQLLAELGGGRVLHAGRWFVALAA